VNLYAKLGIALLALNELRGVIFVSKDGPAMVRSAYQGNLSGLAPLIYDIPIFIIFGVVIYFLKKLLDKKATPE
jgi:hypothetical protein